MDILESQAKISFKFWSLVLVVGPVMHSTGITSRVLQCRTVVIAATNHFAWLVSNGLEIGGSYYCICIYICFPHNDNHCIKPPS